MLVWNSRPRLFGFSFVFLRALCGQPGSSFASLRVPPCPLWLRFWPFLIPAMSCDDVDLGDGARSPPTPVIHPTRSQSSQFGVGFSDARVEQPPSAVRVFFRVSSRPLWSTWFELCFSPCSFVSSVVKVLAFPDPGDVVR